MVIGFSSLRAEQFFGALDVYLITSTAVDAVLLKQIVE